MLVAGDTQTWPFAHPGIRVVAQQRPPTCRISPDQPACHWRAIDPGEHRPAAVNGDPGTSFDRTMKVDALDR